MIRKGLIWKVHAQVRFERSISQRPVLVQKEGGVFRMASVKKPQRVYQKLMRSYKGDISQVCAAQPS